MAYSDISHNNLGLSLKAVSSATINAVSGFFGSVVEAQSRSAEINHLNSLPDADLMRMYGLERDQIVRHVFRDRMF
ncbi:MAG: hypothetical protein GY947_06625 [Rhodobacteraceae bacterium]|nr:hypothetical protein [Paracoccaceae bacterium]